MIHLQIGDQGYLSFQEDLGGYNERFGSIPHVQNIAFLAPLWTFTFSGGQLCIHTIQNQEKISRLKECLEIDGNIEQFKPQMILAVHWMKLNVVYGMPDKVISIYLFDNIFLAFSQLHVLQFSS